MTQLGQIITGQIDLVALIKRSEIVNDKEKTKYLNLLPQLNQEQLKQVSDFFTGAENELAKAKEDLEKKKVEIYNKHLPIIKQAVHEATTLVMKEAENISSKKDDEKTEELLKGLNKV